MAKNSSGMSRNQLLEVAAFNYALAHYRSVIFLREESSELSYSRGYLCGICTAHKVDFDEIKSPPPSNEIMAIQFYHQDSKRKFLKVEIDRGDETA